MTRLLMLVEGQSEEIFVNQTLGPFLAERGVYVQPPILLWTKRIPSGGGFRGGVSNWNQIRKNLLPLLSDGDAWVTTLLDFYGLPDDFPGLDAAGAPRERVHAVQTRFGREFDHPRFIPFLALHEFEAWVFCSPDTVAEHFGQPDLAAKVRKVVDEAGEPEFINHGPTTHPKRRLKGLRADYKETSDGPGLLAKIGVPAIRDACSHFASWLERLEALGAQTPALDSP
jgi:hypothetical protein